MKFLRDAFDKARPNFSEGGKFAFLHSVFDGFETFMFVPGHATHSKVHVRDGIDMKRTMITVVVAMLPVLLFGIWNVGYQHFLATGEGESMMEQVITGLIQVLPIIVVSYGVGLGIEFYFAQRRGHPINEGFLVSGLLIPLILPPTIPLWMVALGTAFAVIIGKEVFGGSGMNLLNPALTARVFLFFAYPAYMSGEFLSNGDAVWFLGNREALVDGFTGATSLSQIAAGVDIQYSVWDMFMGFEKGSIGETSVLATLIGAFILIISGIGSWKIMSSVFVGGFLMGTVFNMIGGTPFLEMPAYYHLLIGGFAFGAVYMATDPVSAAQTETGKIIYGLLIGVMTVLIRVANPAYPEGMMMAILLMNVFAPTIDYFVVESNKKRRLKRATV
ncbi:MAG: NADH:ubiquinone reductase (Na(+)-transporting) subunit B [Bacteroidetes bacterium]|nr:MAG: NADH:ubiquinone reductase (Na(+)-transporting) subunit B [Bacteroidota bacterium]